MSPKRAQARTPAGREDLYRRLKESLRPVGENTLIGRSRRQFRRDAAALIRSTPDHPLRFLLDENGRFKRTYGVDHATLCNRPDLVQMMHVTSAKSGEPDRIVLGSAFLNQFDNVTIEGSGGRGSWVAENVVVDIAGVGVEWRTAQDWLMAAQNGYIRA